MQRLQYYKKTRQNTQSVAKRANNKRAYILRIDFLLNIYNVDFPLVKILSLFFIAVFLSVTSNNLLCSEKEKGILLNLICIIRSISNSINNV